MKENATLDDKALIADVLRRMTARKPGIPAEKVKKFIAKIGSEIGRSGRITEAQVAQLLRQLKNGEL
jgi:hypothetical protein